MAVPSAAVGPDLAADLAVALDAALQQAHRAELLLGGDADDQALIRDVLAGVDATLGAAVSAAPDELRFHLADARSRIAALLLAADQLEELVSHAHAAELRLRAVAEAVSVATRYRRDRDTSIAV